MTQFRQGPLWASPQRVGVDIVRALDRGTQVLYTPGYWRLIMLAVPAVPEFVFRQLRLKSIAPAR